MNPFSQFESDLTVWMTDGDGNPLGDAVWVGSAMERTGIEDGFAEEEANVSGVPWPVQQQLQPVIAIELENVWMARVTGTGASTMAETFRLTRNQKFIFVLIWLDEETGVWVKRIYRHVEIPSLTLAGDEIFRQRLRARAGSCEETSGSIVGTMPDNTAANRGIVRFVDAGGPVDLYRYDLQAQTFTPVNPALIGGRAQIYGAGGGWQFRLEIQGALALAVGNDGTLRCGWLTATGGTFTVNSTLPRVEFHTARRVASVSKQGEVAVPRATEIVSPPPFSSELFKLGNAYIGTGGAYATRFEDRLI